jgi:hypothetical protein
MGKPLQLDDEGNIMNDVETQKTQKAYANYEAELAKKQKERESKAKGEALLKFGTDLMGRPTKKAKGGMVGSASKRADGCAVKGKTRGKIV